MTNLFLCVIGYNMTQVDYSKLINLTKAAKFLDVSYMTVHRWIKEGKLTTTRIGGAPYISLGDLIKLKQERENNG